MRYSKADKRAMWVAMLLLTLIPVSAWLSTPAKADGPSVEQYVGANGPRVCKVLDAFPSFDGIGGIADAIVQEGQFSYYDAGQIEALSVITFCPRHEALMRRFAGLAPQANLGSVGGVYRA